MLRRAAPLAIALLAAAAPSAEAYRFGGERWPGKVIPYTVEAPLYERPVASAARAWNRADVGVRFVRVPSARARLLIRYGPSRGVGVKGCEGENGRAMVGWPGARYTASTIGFTGSCRSARTRRLIALHEMGHVLGLDHENRRCALMNSSIRVRAALPERCRGRRAARRIRRGPLADDVRGARALYRRPAPTESPSVARFSPGAARPLARRPVTFSAGYRNTRLEYRWDFDDPASGSANTSAGLEAVHAFTAPGTYDVTLTVVDSGVPIARRVRRIEVGGQP